MQRWIKFIVFFLLCSVLSVIPAKADSPKPIVMIKINEQIFVDDSLIYDYYGNLKNVVNIWTSVSQADITMAGIFLENGFRVVGSGVSTTTKGNVSKADILKAVEGDDLASVNLGHYLQADLFVVGKAVVKGVPGLKGSLQKSARANVNVRVIKVSNGEIIAVESANAAAAAIDELSAGVEAIKTASKLIAQNLMPKLSKQ